VRAAARHFVVRSAGEKAAVFGFVYAAPLLEKVGNATQRKRTAKVSA
jgi:hypothetical protein